MTKGAKSNQPEGVLEAVSRPECADPIDFSFLFLASLDDAKDSTPRQGLTFWFTLLDLI